jgi:hypothetical protein
MAVGGGSGMGALCLSPWCRVELSVGLSASIGDRGDAQVGWEGWEERACTRGAGGVRASEKIQRAHTTCARDNPTQRHLDAGERSTRWEAWIPVSKSPFQARERPAHACPVKDRHAME